LADARGSDLSELHASEGGSEVAPEQRPVALSGGGTQRPALHEPVLDPAFGIVAERALAARRVGDQAGKLLGLDLLPEGLGIAAGPERLGPFFAVRSVPHVVAGTMRCFT
jgi:hypothetical protein